MIQYLVVFGWFAIFQNLLVEVGGDSSSNAPSPEDHEHQFGTTEKRENDSISKSKELNLINLQKNWNGSFLSVPVYESKFPYKKCHCDVQQMWDGVECQAADADIIYNLYRQIQPFSESHYENFMFSSVDIDNEIRCPIPKQIGHIGDDFIITDDGSLFHEETGLNFSINEYCFEIYSDGQYLSVKASVCLAPPAIPYCCDNGQCHDIAVLERIAVTFSQNHFYWNQYDLLAGEKPVCDDETSQKNLILEDNEDKLFFHFGYEHIEMVFTPTNSTSDRQIFSVDKYCIENNQDDTLEVRFCYQSPSVQHEIKCRDSVCIRKCCPPDELFVENGGCQQPVSVKDLYVPTFHNEHNRVSARTPENLHIEHLFPWCQSSGSYIIDPKLNPTDKFYLMDNGSLYITLSNLAVPASKYCVENFEDQDGFVSTKAIVCFLEIPEVVDHCKEVHKILYPILIVISCLFLAITLTVYASLPELRAKLHGKCLLSHVSSLMVAFFCQLVISWCSKYLSMEGCKIIALGNQVSFLWAFFWLNVMCFDIWWTLKSMSPSPKSGESTRKRFIYYSIYAWGCPLVIASMTGILEFLPKSYDKSGLILPGFGVRSCWFQDTLSTWIYFHGFTLFLYVLNILFFFHVAAILIKGQKATEGILRKTKQQQQERMYLYLKLFIVMGITWICEVASWQEGTCSYWIFTDIINSLQGVFIFFIFMCNKKVYQKVHAKGVPFFTRIKSMARAPSSMASGSRRTTTTQTSVESSTSRRLSSSLQPSLSNLTRKSS